MFLGLPDPDSLVRGMDPDPSIIKQNSKKNLDSYCVVTSFDNSSGRLRLEALSPSLNVHVFFAGLRILIRLFS
jgi:hypothetical protein